MTHIMTGIKTADKSARVAFRVTIKEQIRQLPINQLEDLGEALLDVESEADLLNWLASGIRF